MSAITSVVPSEFRARIRVDIVGSIMIHFPGAKITSYVRVYVLDRDERFTILVQVGRELDDTRSGIQIKILQMLVDGRRVRYIRAGQM